MKRFLSLILALVMVLSLVACGGGASDAEGGDEGAADSGYADFKTAIMLPGTEGENAIFQMLCDGIRAACADAGAPEPKVVEGGGEWTSYGKYLTSLAAAQEYDVIFTTTDVMRYNVNETLKAFPDQKIVILDADLLDYESKFDGGKIPATVWGMSFDLYQLGYLGGKATGTYDEATEKAVRAFQKKTKGLWEDGVAGPDTLAALYSDSAAKATSLAASTGETLEKGSEGEAVRSLQKRLKELGYLSGTVDGSFGIATEAAVIAFQQRNGLTADGKAGTATLNRLYSEDAVKNGGSPVDTSARNSSSASGGKETSGIASTGYVTLEDGSSGDPVKKLQERLKKLGYYNGSIDGRYGEGTAAAVMAFQLRNNLTVDGKAGPATQRALYGSGTAISYSALREGEEGAAVKNLQYTLYELGYYDGKIDGEYGQTTSDAVRAFQIQNKLSPVDGVAGSGTLARLYSSEALPATAASVDYDTARPGDRGEMVVEIQDCLVQLGYLDRITGTYDDETVEAVKAFQRKNGLTADGVAGERTLVILFGY